VASSPAVGSFSKKGVRLTQKMRVGPCIHVRRQRSFFEMTISKPTFAPSTPCTIHFECLESGPNDTARVRRLTGILRRARVKILILVYGSFWFQLSGFSSNSTGRHETKIVNRYGAADQNIQTFISNLGYL
jgi:hypothetical protein